MAFIAVPDCAQFTFHYGAQGDMWTNTVYATKPDFSAQEMANIALSIYNEVKEPLAEHLADNYQTRGITCTDIRTAEGSVIRPAAVFEPGLDATEPLPLHEALVFTLRSAARGRSGRGRLYFSGFSEGQMDSGIFASDLMDDIDNVLDSIWTTFESNDWVWCIVSRYTNGEPRPYGVTYPITGKLCRSMVPGTQRRRTKRI